jgi:hypothetical protein
MTIFTLFQLLGTTASRANPPDEAGGVPRPRGEVAHVHRCLQIVLAGGKYAENL